MSTKAPEFESMANQALGNAVLKKTCGRRQLKLVPVWKEASLRQGPSGVLTVLIKNIGLRSIVMLGVAYLLWLNQASASQEPISTPSFAEMPLDTVVHVMSFLPPQATAAMGGTCRLLYECRLAEVTQSPFAVKVLQTGQQQIHNLQEEQTEPGVYRFWQEYTASPHPHETIRIKTCRF